MKTHLHVLIRFYDIDPATQGFINPVMIDVRANSIMEAVNKAVEMAGCKAINKKFYSVESVIEHDHLDGEKEK